MKKTLRPIVHRDEYTLLVERELLDYIREVLFEPLKDLLKDAGLEARVNSKDALRAAIQNGRVWYSDGVFSGKFNAEISREIRALGGKPMQGGGFTLHRERIPMDLMGAIDDARSRSDLLHRSVDTLLQQMSTNVVSSPVGLSFIKAVDKIVGDLQKQFVETVASEESISIQARVTPGIAKALDEKLTHNADLAIKNFTAKQIADLRAKVQKNALAGGRADSLVSLIETEYGVGKRHAAFIAEQETSLAVSKFREERYKSLGATEYEWSTSGDEKVRADHRALNGRRFSWDSPPIVDKATGRRANPGEDYRCRCVALPVVNLT